MRYIKDIMLEYAIVHVLDYGADEAIISKEPLKVNEESELFIRKHIIKCLNSDDTLTARTMSDQSKFMISANKVVNDWSEFYDFSVKFTETFFNKIKHTDLSPCDLLFVQYIANEQRCFAMIKLNHDMTYKHNISFDDDKLNINLYCEHMALPSFTKKIQKAFFFTKAPDMTIDIIVVNNDEKAEEQDPDYFTDWLEVVLINDDIESTRLLRPAVEKWTQKCLMDQIEEANKVRTAVDEVLLMEDQADLLEISSILFPGEDTKEIRFAFEEDMRCRGIKTSKPINLDKSYLEKSMKKKTIKTDTGISISAEFDFYKDSQRYIEKRNGDGTIDIILKNVRNVQVK